MCNPESPGCRGKNRKNCINLTHMQWVLPRAANLCPHPLGIHILYPIKRGTSALSFIGIKSTLFFQNVGDSIILRKAFYANSSVRGVQS